MKIKKAAALEFLIFFAVLALALVATSSAVLSNLNSQHALVDQELIFSRARELISRVSNQPFGSYRDPEPSSEQIDHLLGRSDRVSTVTLEQLLKGPDRGLWSFRYQDMKAAGVWTLSLSRADRNIIDSPIRIAVKCQGRELLATFRSEREVWETW